MMKHFSKIIFTFWVFAFPFISCFAQQEEDNDERKSAKSGDTTLMKTGWKSGYIITKTGHDTIRGFVKIKLSSLHEVTKAVFKYDTLDKHSKLDITPDTTWRFLYGNTIYKYVNYIDTASSKKKRKQSWCAGWVEILVNGKIVLSLGVTAKNDGAFSNGVPVVIPMGGGGVVIGVVGAGQAKKSCFLLRKGTEPTIILELESKTLINSIPALYKCVIGEKNKRRLFDLISDDKILVAKYKQEILHYGDIPDIIRDYNINHP